MATVTEPREEKTERPKIGLGVFVIRENNILLGKRKNSHGNGCWALPGGHIELYESFEECAKREVLEETGLKVRGLKFLTATNDIYPDESLHYITIIMRAEHTEGDPQLMEPHKCSEWKWFSWNDMPEPLFLPLKNLKENGFDPSVLIKK